MPFEKIKRKFVDPIKKALEPRPPVHTNVVPEEIQDTSGNVAHEYYNFVSIVGDQIGPDGITQGAYAVANGKSGDSTKFPLPQDPGDPESQFFDNGTIGMVKSIGTNSVLIEIPESGRPDNRKGHWHMNKINLNQLKPGDKRQSPLKSWAFRQFGYSLNVTAKEVLNTINK